MMGSMMRRAMLGDGSTLSLDFTTGVLDPRLTFTRSTSGTYIGADGLVKTATTNTARFDYDPTTLTPRGLLIEGSATNLAFYSEYINPNAAPWNVYWFVAGAGASVTPVSQADPAGGTTASRCILGTSGSGRVYNGISTTAGVTYTLSFWARSVSGTTSLAFWHFNSATGNSTAVTVSTSWQRYQVTILGRTGGGFVECGIANTTTNAATVDFWGLQLESGSGASSYIPTGASQGSRAADSAVMADIGTLNYSNTNGTLYWSGIINKRPTSYITLIGFMTAADQPTYETFGNALSYFAAARGPTLNIGGSNEVSRTYVQGSLIKYSSSVNTLVNPIVAVNLNGSASSTNKSGTGNMHVATRFVLGRQPSSTYGAEYPSVTIRDIKYWPTTKTAAELSVLTA